MSEKNKNWETSRKEHEKGLATKEKLQKEAEERQLKEQPQRDAGYRGGG